MQVANKVKKFIRKMLLLLLFSAILLPIFITIGQVKAGSAFLAWGGLNPEGDAPATEYDTEFWVCNEVAYNIIPSYWFDVSGNNYDYFTSQEWVNYCLQYVQSNQMGTYILWVGDFNHYTLNPGDYHFVFFKGENAIPTTYAQAYCITDFEVYDQTGSTSVVRNMFDWTCSCAGLYYDSQATAPCSPSWPSSAYNSMDAYGWIGPYANEQKIGMPLAWAHTLTMAKEGYGSPGIYDNCCYIGWQNASPYLDTDAPYSWVHNINMPYYYYAYSMGAIDNYIHNARDALDFASYTIYEDSFGNSPYYYGYENDWGLWSKMQVLGNSLYP